MAKFRALTNIRHGEVSQDENGQDVHKVHEFPAGSIVRGLASKFMKELWDAGVLEQVDEKPEPEAKVTSTPVTPAAPPDGSADGSEGDPGAGPKAE